MGKNTDKLYVTHSEHSGIDGRHGSSGGITQRKLGQVVQRLPFIYCALSLQTWEHPVCVIDADRNATMFDLLVIVPWLQTKGTNPLTGQHLDAKELIKLTFMKNEQGEFCDPVTMKVFNDHTHIVAIAQTGNVFAQETIERLNYKAKHWKDLLTDEPFSRSDVITIQDPHRLTNNTIPEQVRAAAETSADTVIYRNTESSNEREGKVKAAQAALERFRKNDNPIAQPKAQVSENKVLPYNAAHYSTGYTAASFTNSGMAVRTKNDRALLTEEEYLLHPKKVKIKGLCIMKTNLGNLDLELWPEHAPKAVYNFVKLSGRGYYDGVTFHRNIPGFMIQGGDPTGRGTGGSSIYGKEFEDEISAAHSHDRRGLLCMANKGPATNSSQFFLTYDSAKHLDKKHTIFGRIIGNTAALDKFESAPNKGDKPRDPIVIEEVQVVLDPFVEHLRLEADKRDSHANKLETTEDDNKTWNSLPARNTKLNGTSDERAGTAAAVGHYLKNDHSADNSNLKADLGRREIEPVQEAKRKRLKTTSFGNFSAW